MKIYFIGQKGIPGKSGGVEKHVEELAVRLAEAGHEIFAYTRPNYTRPEIKKFKGVNLISLPSISRKNFDAISHTFRACLDVSRRDADIIHFHSIGPSSLIWLVRILKPGIPIVATFHTRCYQHKKWGMFARLYLKIGELAACVLPDATIAVSQSLKNYALKKYGKKYGSCISYIPNGVSLGEVAGAEKISEWGLEKDNYILTVSRLVRHKGIHYLLEAYKKIKTDKKLVIVGESSFTDNYVSELKKQAAEDKNIIFTGAQNGEKLKELFANSYLFIQPSESEGLSIALLEAMAYGRCALVSDIPENKEAVGEAGFTFINKNAADLADKMNFLLTNPDLTVKTGQAARIRAEKYYNWKAITEEIIKVYEQASLKRKEKKQRF